MAQFNYIYKMPGAPDVDDMWMIPYDQPSYDQRAIDRGYLWNTTSPLGYEQNGSSRQRASVLPLTPAAGQQDMGGRQFAFSPEFPNLQAMFNVTRDCSIITDVGALIEPEPWNGNAFVKPIAGPFAAHDGQQLYQEIGQGAPISFGAVGRMALYVADVNNLVGPDRKQVGFNINRNFVAGSSPEGAMITVPSNGNVNDADTIAQLGYLNTPDPLNPADRLAPEVIEPSMRAQFARYLRATDLPRPDGSLLRRTLYDLNKSIHENVDLIKSVLGNAVTVEGNTNYQPNPNNGFREDDITITVDLALRQSQFAGAPMEHFGQYGGPWDSHGLQAASITPALSQLDDWIAEFREQHIAAGTWDQVAVVMAGEFGRTLIPNSSGTDHAGAGHAIVFGGAVDGGKIFFAEPVAGEPAGPMDRRLGHPQNFSPRGRFSPAIDWSQIYGDMLKAEGATEAEIEAAGVFTGFAALNDFPGTPGEKCVPWIKRS